MSLLQDCFDPVIFSIVHQKLCLKRITKRIGKKHLEGLVVHLPVVGVGFTFQLFMELEMGTFRTDPAFDRERCSYTDLERALQE